MNFKKTVAIRFLQVPALCFRPNDPWLFQHPDIHRIQIVLRVRRTLESGHFRRTKPSGLTSHPGIWSQIPSFLRMGKWGRLCCGAQWRSHRVYVMANGWRFGRSAWLMNGRRLSQNRLWNQRTEIASHQSICDSSQELMIPNRSMWKLERKAWIPLVISLEKWSFSV